MIELCHDGDFNDETSTSYCAKISEGGCPCPNSDEVKCGANEYYSGYCARACCDWTVEEACFDSNNQLLGCARFDEGRCNNSNEKRVARGGFRSSGTSAQGMKPKPNSLVSEVKQPSPRFTSFNHAPAAEHPTPSLTLHESKKKPPNPNSLVYVANRPGYEKNKKPTSPTPQAQGKRPKPNSHNTNEAPSSGTSAQGMKPKPNSLLSEVKQPSTSFTSFAHIAAPSPSIATKMPSFETNETPSPRMSAQGMRPKPNSVLFEAKHPSTKGMAPKPNSLLSEVKQPSTSFTSFAHIAAPSPSIATKMPSFETNETPSPRMSAQGMRPKPNSFLFVAKHPSTKGMAPKPNSHLILIQALTPSQEQVST
jgi:hypothetical protein